MSFNFAQRISDVELAKHIVKQSTNEQATVFDTTAINGKVKQEHIWIVQCKKEKVFAQGENIPYFSHILYSKGSNSFLYISHEIMNKNTIF